MMYFGAEVVLAMTHVKNLRLTRALKGSISPAEMQDQIVPSLQHLRVLGQQFTYSSMEKNAH